MGVFTDEASVTRLETSMKKTGFLPAENMRRSFDLMRSNDLIWNYVVSSWLMGEDPPAFDILSWNADSTRMPAEMHSFYLRSCYLENQLAAGRWSSPASGWNSPASIKISTSSPPSKITSRRGAAPTREHCCPPASQVRAVQAGHIAGIVNPPNPKSIHRVARATTVAGRIRTNGSPSATTHPITWWEDWAGWIETRSGGLRRAAPHREPQAQADRRCPGTYGLRAGRWLGRCDGRRMAYGCTSFLSLYAGILGTVRQFPRYREPTPGATRGEAQGPHVHAAVDAPDLAGDVGGGVGGEEVHDPGDLLGPAEPAQRDLRP